ncbi:MAG: glycosyltransferase family 9 protein, partial [Betaproteobacteria bacterium]|nr:glycosyltransferase family 9 protein [Betaproteobacteria bacterium]
MLLATPLLRSFKLAWPGARIDALVFRGTEPVLANNTDLHSVLTVAERPRFAEHARFHAAILRRYDLAVSLLTGDRPTLYAWAAGRSRAGLQMNDRTAWLKRRLLDVRVPFDDLNTHTIRMNLALADALRVTAVPEVVVSWGANDAQQVEALGLQGSDEPYAVLHPS